MKKLTVSTLALFSLLILAGCGLFGTNPSGPNKFEEHFFDVQTNYVPRVLLQTNITQLTNNVTVFHTNEVGKIVEIPVAVVVPKYDLITITQQIPSYVWTPKTNTAEYAQAAGSVSNMIAPGSGGAVAGILLGLAGAWAKLRSSKKTNTNLAQGTETLLELLQTLPDGNKNVAAAKQFLQKAQSDDGVSKQVKAVRADVNNLQAKADVSQIKNTIRAFSVPNVPGNPVV